MNTLLVVDDEKSVRYSFERIFEKYYSVITAEDGEAALRVLDDHINDIDVIFLDVRMPGLNGIQLLREIKQMKMESRIILFTASVWESVREEVMDLGVDGFIRKPFDIWEIEALARGTAPAA